MSISYIILRKLLGLSLLLLISLNSEAQQSQKQVVTTFTIIQDMAQNVAGSSAKVLSITKPGAEIHDYEPTPSDIVKAYSADLLLWNGLGLERWFEKFYRNLNAVPSVIITEGIQPLGIGEGPYSGKPNPHSWMSPANALIYVENIRKIFIKIDPDNQSIYDKNAAIYSSQLKIIDSKLRNSLSVLPENKRWLVTSEGAFSYLARDYGLKELFLWPVNADEEGTPQQIRKVIDSIRKNQIPVVFSESTISNRAMLQVSSEAGVKYGGILYVDSLTDKNGPADTYLKLLEFNVDTILKGLQLEG